MRGAVIAAATALVILGASILPFTTPAYVRAEQDRVGVPALTGYSRENLDTIVGSLLGDLFLWRGSFEVAIDGAPVLNDRERAHMLDVRGVFAGVLLVILAAALFLLVQARRTRADAGARAAAWRAAGNGAKGLAVATIGLGIIAALAFEAAFEIFHRLFFSSGSYTFDPARDRIVQLFPFAFWSETTIALGVVMVVVIVGVAWLAARRARAAHRRAPVHAARSISELGPI